MSMLSPGGIDTPFNNGKWNPDRQKKSPLEMLDDRKKKKRYVAVDPASQEVLGNLAHLLSNVARDGSTISASTSTFVEK